MNALYSIAETAYLALPEPSSGSAFDPTRLSPEKLAYVVGRLEGLSVTENIHPGDLLGEFFEQIVSQDFTQTKGQFFTPMNLVKFMLALCDATGKAEDIMKNSRDFHGRPRLPYVIDPSCGSGTFLIEYMKLVSKTLGTIDTASALPRRIREAHATWFGGESRSVWAREFIFGIENNYDLGLASKVNMVLHGDGSMNTWITSGLQSFHSYWIEGRNNILGTAHDSHGGFYEGQTNQQFDLILSNPPFSLKLTPDEKRNIQEAFTMLATGLSERIFIERWYQLLRENGKFCCVLPETILDTSTNEKARLFLYQFLQIEAVVSLPYDTFRPFTGTKTCVVLARKRSNDEALAWQSSWNRHKTAGSNRSTRELFERVVEELGWGQEPIFMAEPAYVGYKRRKGLPDLPQPNDLYQEDEDGNIRRGEDSDCVLNGYLSGSGVSCSPRFGFWTDLRRIGSRNGQRLDPKYRWLWDYLDGVAHGDPVEAVPLRTVMQLVQLPKVTKGELEEEAQLIDLEAVESRQALLRPDIPIVTKIGSDKVTFGGCELAISKLEPYLGKILLEAPAESIGSTEWVGLRRENDMPLQVLAYILMLPDLCESYRRLQSGKRHARFNPEEFLDLKVQFPSDDEMHAIQTRIQEGRLRIIHLREEATHTRESLDTVFGPINRTALGITDAYDLP